MNKVSIIVPAYNESTRINKCIDSLLKQSYKDIEIIVVNDGSTDNTLEILEKYNDKRLKILTKINEGQGAARNYGIKKSTGKYLMFVDADDYVDKDIVKLLLENLKNNDSDISICNLCKVYGNKKVVFKNFEYFCDDNILNFMMSHPGPVGRLYKRNLFTDNNINFVTGRINEDLGTIPLLGIYAKKISYIENDLYYYVIHENSTTMQTVYSKKMEDIFQILNSLKYEFETRSQDKYNSVLEYLYIEHLLYSSSLKFADFDEGLKQINKIIDIIKNEFPNWKQNQFLKNKSIKFKIICYLVYNNKIRLVKLLKHFKK